MSEITAKVIEDSISPEGIRLTTFQLKYPRFIHAEFMTHRVFSRNAGSSRAIPILTSLRAVLRSSVMPISWGKNQKGMQAGAEMTGFRRRLAKLGWNVGRFGALAGAWLAMKAGAHKQVVNRMLEPWSHIEVVVTATDWANFFELRLHKDADPTMQALAVAMDDARALSTPRLLARGEWHLPYISQAERETFPIDMLKKMSSARCARVSYLTHDQQHPSSNRDLDLYDRLVGSKPWHASPVEHQATPDWMRPSSNRWAAPRLHGNLTGWRQNRKILEKEFAA